MKWLMRKIAENKAIVLAASAALAVVHPAASDVVTAAVKTVEAAYAAAKTVSEE